MANEPDLLADRENDVEWVTYLQGLLRNWGYWNGEDDGHFGPEIDEAVRKFQGDQGLVVDGWVGPKTWSVLVQEAVMLNLADFPALAALADTGGDENSVKQLYAGVLEVDDLDRFAMADDANGNTGVA